MVVSDMKKQLRTGKVFVDWSQNDEHKTTIGVYSLRAREHPTASTPVTWEEVERAGKKKDLEPAGIRGEAGGRACGKDGRFIRSGARVEAAAAGSQGSATSAVVEAEPTISIAAQAEDEAVEPRVKTAKKRSAEARRRTVRPR